MFSLTHDTVMPVAFAFVSVLIGENAKRIIHFINCVYAVTMGSRELLVFAIMHGCVMLYHIFINNTVWNIYTQVAWHASVAGYLYWNSTYKEGTP